MFTMRFGMRSTSTDGPARADLYGAAVEMAEWAESRGCLGAQISEHHGSEDGYLPSPVPLATAMAARTSTLSITVAALILPFYEPVKLAEDMTVIDLISRGRVSYVVGIGYRDEEFAMFGVDKKGRGEVVEERIRILQRLFAGEEVSIGERKARITPLPFTPGGPMIAYGGGTAVAARRAGRLGLMFISESHDDSLGAAYASTAPAGAPGCLFPPPDLPLTLFVADDPERAWAEIGEYLLVDAAGYGAWNAGRTGTASVSFATTVAELQAERGSYRIVTPAEAKDLLSAGMPLALQPLVGGLPPDVAWRYLEQAVTATTP
jgi:alkanesulfonate monooxygenase SsuD/methylene tetrahydromethanopterin reductase-like flavin-dependent oxidoreductase (luciferase family)